MSEHEQAHPESPRRLTHAESARTLLATASRGVLSTIDAHDGYPYGSLAEYVSTDEGDPVFLLSNLAAHTANFTEDARASLFLSPAMADARPLALERVTLLGDIEAIAEPGELREAYLDRHPHAAGYVDFTDFGFWRLRVRRLRYIGGFGRMSWVTLTDYRRAQPDPLAGVAAGAIEHMNDDHADALVDYARALGGVDDAHHARMASLDRYGFDLQVQSTDGGEQLVRIPFDPPLTRPSKLRAKMVELVDEARAK